MSHYHRAGKLSGILVSALALAGCMSFNPKSLRQMETALMESNPDLVIESSMTFGIGALAIDFVDFAFVHERSIDVSKISRADIGIYEINGMLVFDDFQMPQAVTSDRNCPRRDVILQIREADERVQIVACIRNEKVTGLSIVVLEPRELVIVNARGNFEALINSLVKASVKRNKHEADAQASDTHSQTSAVASQSAVSGKLPPT